MSSSPSTNLETQLLFFKQLANEFEKERIPVTLVDADQDNISDIDDVEVVGTSITKPIRGRSPTGRRGGARKSRGRRGQAQ